MKTILIFVAIFGMWCGISSADSAEQAWNKFKGKFCKKYDNATEEKHRFKVFSENKQVIDTHNDNFKKGLVTFTLGVNQYADLSSEEFVDVRNGYDKLANRVDGVSFISPNTDLPDNIDWRLKGAVTPVRNQGECGSCWAFASVGALEGHTFRKTGVLTQLSEQHLLDCSRDFGNFGCDGGLMAWTYNYAKSVGGVVSAASYPYEGDELTCRFNRSNIVAAVKGYVSLPPNDEQKLKEALATRGPVSVAIDASHKSLQLYHGGIYNEPKCRTKLDHAVLAVGYGTENGQDYWLIKNSWGTGWGEGGYVRISRNKNNHCGVATMGSYPLV